MQEHWCIKSEGVKVTSRNRLLERGICTAGSAEDFADPSVLRTLLQWTESTRPTLKSTRSMEPSSDAVNKINVVVMQYHDSLLMQQDSKVRELDTLREEVSKLRERVDRIDALFAREEEVDREITEEIAGIEGRPVSPLDQKLEDLLPSPDELDELLED